AASPKTLIGWVRERAARHGDRVNARYGFPGRPDETLTFAELERASLRFAACYVRAGVQRGDAIVILLDHGADLMPAFHGAQWIGAIPAFLQAPAARGQIQYY